MTTKHRNHASITNPGSMADIAFLLLIFFMLTTTIVNDKGLTLLLPPSRKQPIQNPVHERNLFKILLNSHDKLLVEDEPWDSAEGLRIEIKKFILNYGTAAGLSENPKKAVVSIKTNRGTSQQAFIQVLDEAKAAYYEIYSEKVGLSPSEYRALEAGDPRFTAVRQSIPMNISIAEPNLQSWE